MVKKSVIAGLTAIVLSLCCGLSFAAEENDQKSINLGNEITKSIDKTGSSFENMTNDVFSGNVVNDMRNGVDNITDMGRTENDKTDNTRTDINTTNNNGMMNTARNGMYNTVRTTAEGTTNMSTMSTTTWMWIILAVAAIIIVAAIWYYATQNND